jgi:four helix bundle protein
MDSHQPSGFNQQLRKRTLQFATRVFEKLSEKKGPVLTRVPIQQLIRCSTSVAANFSSATRARSDAEFYSKICIVTEECDESLFWLDFLIGVKVFSPAEVESIRDEGLELLKIFSSSKARLRDRLDGNKK